MTTAADTAAATLALSTYATTVEQFDTRTAYEHDRMSVDVFDDGRVWVCEYDVDGNEVTDPTREFTLAEAALRFAQLGK